MTTSTTTIFYDSFTLDAAGETVGANLNGKALEQSSVGAKTWTSADLFSGGQNLFAQNSSNGYIAPNTSHSSSLASVPYKLSSGIYELSADIFPDYSGSWGTLGLSFSVNNSGAFGWSANMINLAFLITGDGNWTLYGSQYGTNTRAWEMIRSPGWQCH